MTEERDELWESLRPLKPEIEDVAGGKLDMSERQRQLLALIARIVLAELNFRSGTKEPQGNA